MTINWRKFCYLINTLSFVGLIVLLLGQACGGNFKSVGTESLESNLCAINSADIDIENGKSTVSLVYGRQVLDNMVACTGIQSPSAQTEAEWQRRSSSLSEYGYATEVSAPMLMGISAIAGEVCNDLINLELLAAQPEDRAIFSSLSLDQEGYSQEELKSVISLLAISCWQRNESEEEQHILIEQISGIADTSIDAALSTCTVMLSSLSAIQM